MSGKALGAEIGNLVARQAQVVAERARLAGIHESLGAAQTALMEAAAALRGTTFELPADLLNGTIRNLRDVGTRVYGHRDVLFREYTRNISTAGYELAASHQAVSVGPEGRRDP